MAEAVVCKARCLRDLPAFAVVLTEKGFNAAFDVASRSVDHLFKVTEGHQHKYRVAKLRIFVPFVSPEPFRISGYFFRID